MAIHLHTHHTAARGGVDANLSDLFLQLLLHLLRLLHHLLHVSRHFHPPLLSMETPPHGTRTAACSCPDCEEHGRIPCVLRRLTRYSFKFRTVRTWLSGNTSLNRCTSGCDSARWVTSS